MQQLLGQIASLALLLFPFQLIDQIHGVVEAHPLALMNGHHTQRGGQVGFAGAGAADQDQVMRAVHEGAAGQLLDLPLIERGFLPVETAEVAMNRETGGLELIAQAAHLAIRLLGLDQPIQPDFRARGLA